MNADAFYEFTLAVCRGSPGCGINGITTLTGILADVNLPPPSFGLRTTDGVLVVVVVAGGDAAKLNRSAFVVVTDVGATLMTLGLKAFVLVGEYFGLAIWSATVPATSLLDLKACILRLRHTPRQPVVILWVLGLEIG